MKQTEQKARIIALEEQVARDRTQVIADAAAIHVVGSAIYDLQQEVMEQAEQVTQVTSTTDSAIDAAIQDERMVELERRIEQLERRAALSADEEQRLQVVANAAVVREHSKRIERLEAALGTWLVAVNYTAATPPMNEIDVTAGKPVYSIPE